jgi:hypothetical protein
MSKDQILRDKRAKNGARIGPVNMLLISGQNTKESLETIKNEDEVILWSN